MRPNILALDASAGACSVACLQGGIAVEKYECLARGHAEALVPMVASVMENSGLPYERPLSNRCIPCHRNGARNALSDTSKVFT